MIPPSTSADSADGDAFGDRRLSRWLLLLPLAYLLHLAEEWWGGEGFAAWTERAIAPVSTTRFLVVNSIAWPLFAISTLLAVFRSRLAWFPVAFATVVVVNAALHALGSLATSSYSPGLVTGLALYLPLGSWALREGHAALAPERFARGVAIGVLIHAVVIVIAFA